MNKLLIKISSIINKSDRQKINQRIEIMKMSEDKIDNAIGLICEVALEFYWKHIERYYHPDNIRARFSKWIG